jgi:hypothetical protein
MLHAAPQTEVAELLGEADKRRTGVVDARGLATLLVQGV